MLWQERETARQYNRWMSRVDPLARHVRWTMGSVGAFFVNTPIVRLVDELDLQPEHRVLDMGCGRAPIARFLAQQIGFRSPPVGLDVSTVMLRLARSDHDPAAPVELIAASGSSLPFANETFDFVVAAHVWKHLDDRAFLHNLMEIQRVLRLGGSCIAWEFAPARSHLLDRWNRRFLMLGDVKSAHLRGFHILASAAIDAGFAKIRRLQLGPFLWPPIQRVAVRLYKTG